MAINLEINPNIFNPIYLKHQLNNNNRYQIYFGGSSSGKSFSLAQRTVLDVFKGNRNYLIVRNVQSTLKRSCLNEITKAISNFKLNEYFQVNKTDMIITCKLNNKQILFCGLDDVEKVKSITPIDGVITDIWVEEATETDYKAVKQLDKRLRGKSKVVKRLTLSFNPILKDHWLYTEYFDIWEDDKQYVEKDNVSILKTTYKDNKFLAEDDIKALENESDKYYYEVYTLGNWGVLGAVIFKNWRVEDFSDIENTFDNFRHGIDWGFADDPFAYVKSHYDRMRRKLYICDEIEAVGLLNREAAPLVSKKANGDLVICDNASPKDVAEFSDLRINAVSARKGAGSIEYGIKFLQGLEIIIHPRCQNFKNEINKYKYKEDKNGNILPIAVDKDNHLIDALRYSLENDMEYGGISFLK
ncbi:TPA: PBSX family phage terminase large subunit [Clostridioides difficile]|uniref:PBSX family phage terminase large subunit n=1 Tax=Clostridioides difficile TaxID=1496 RepID=UPI00038C74C8|nr:PBSX family phage terminase large subunit [Clostridioides difficile]EQH27624.1 phage terminase, large subunit, PBSX family [Clostridioides difficile DA00212]HBF1268678.1 PBSX family phage terminase large subunit [Clostridioides difficile]HBH1309013.1 PBSX family phage terminase large subunit [Clostridioides difficile]HCQ5483078.1 PBSX family phage terminase large subunit [Clostridioides difficile]HEK4787400.1 PBSX family phage terminase large subunit [Clostridioides difficile]